MSQTILLLWNRVKLVYLRLRYTVRSWLSTSEYLCPYCGKEPPPPRVFHDKPGKPDIMAVSCCAEAQVALRRFILSDRGLAGSLPKEP